MCRRLRRDGERVIRSGGRGVAGQTGMSLMRTIVPFVSHVLCVIERVGRGGATNSRVLICISRLSSRVIQYGRMLKR